MSSTLSHCRFMQYSILSLSIATVFASSANEIGNLTYAPSINNFGGTGLIQIPTARMSREGEFNIGMTLNEDYYHAHTTLQLFPWLETTFRYTQVTDVLYSADPTFSGDTIYTDKGIDVKFRLIEESYWLPETSIGMRDFGGTGLFDSEFIAASKRFGPFDATIGVGWGYIGNSANLQSGNKDTSVDCERNTGFKGTGGSVDYDRWFKGCSSVFAGLEYQTPWQPLRLKVEYDSNDYLSDFPVTRGAKSLPQNSNLNYGLLYKFGNWGDLHLNYERGNTWTLGFSLNTNFNDLKSSWNEKPKKVVQQATSDQKVEYPAIANELSENAGYAQARFYRQNDTMTVVATQTKYRDKSKAHDRAGRILLSHFPTLKTINIIETALNQPTTETRINTAKFKDAIEHNYINAKVSDSTRLVAPKIPDIEAKYKPEHEWKFGTAPKLNQSFGGSENFYMYDIGVLGDANKWLTDNLNVSASGYLNLVDNYDQFLYKTPPDGTDLKRVRTLIRQFVSDNPVQINNIQVTWMDKFSDSLYYQAYAGYLETMFGGVGGEVLYRDIGSDWAFGVDINYVKQRDPDNMFGFFNDEIQLDQQLGLAFRVQTGTLTGNASVYYQPSWFDDVALKVSFGKYLAEDVGVTVDFSKRFDTGVIVGAYATKTNLSAEEFGEGSFTKGFYISIPFDLILTSPTQNRANFNWQPLTRDGGQPLGRRYHLIGLTDERSPWFNAPPKAN